MLPLPLCSLAFYFARGLGPSRLQTPRRRIPAPCTTHGPISARPFAPPRPRPSDDRTAPTGLQLPSHGYPFFSRFAPSRLRSRPSESMSEESAAPIVARHGSPTWARRRYADTSPATGGTKVFQRTCEERVRDVAYSASSRRYDAAGARKVLTRLWVWHPPDVRFDRGTGARPELGRYTALRPCQCVMGPLRTTRGRTRMLLSRCSLRIEYIFSFRFVRISPPGPNMEHRDAREKSTGSLSTISHLVRSTSEPCIRFTTVLRTLASSRYNGAAWVRAGARAASLCQYVGENTQYLCLCMSRKCSAPGDIFTVGVPHGALSTDFEFPTIVCSCPQYCQTC